MAFKYNGVEPTAIKYNGTDLTVLKYGIGLTAVWGKPFSLTIQAGANTTVTVRRTSSPNQHASDGNITSGGIVYYGDIIIVKVTPINSCRLTTFTINGTEYASNQTIEVEQVVTVTEAVSIVTNAENAGSWHTYWTGSSTYGFDTIHLEEYTTSHYFTTDTFSPTFSEPIPVRITGSFYVGNNSYGGGKPTRGTFADKELPYNTGTNGTSYAKVELQSTSAGYNIFIVCHTDGYLNSYVGGGLSQITITKIDIFT